MHENLATKEDVERLRNDMQDIKMDLLKCTAVGWAICTFVICIYFLVLFLY